MHHSFPLSPPLTDTPEVFQRTFENILKNTDVGHNCFQCLTLSPTHLRNLTVSPVPTLQVGGLISTG